MTGSSRRISAAGLAIVLILIAQGCSSSPGTEQTERSTVKPIDRVREGIVSVSEDLQRAAASSQSVAGSSSRSQFAKDLRKLESSVATLRADAAELHDRAADYLLVWGGQTYLVTSDSHASSADDRRGSAKAKYDELVGQLVAARDIVVPLLNRFKAIEASSDRSGIAADVQKAESDSVRAVEHLDASLRRLNELKSMLQTAAD